MTINEIKKMLDEISQGTWVLDEDGCVETENGGAICMLQPHGCLRTVSKTGECFDHTDGKFIAAAPTIIRYLLNKIEQLEATI